MRLVRTVILGRDSYYIRSCSTARSASGSNDQVVVLGPGGYTIKPRGEVHAMWNAGSTRARMIEVISPAGFEGFFRELPT